MAWDALIVEQSKISREFPEFADAYNKTRQAAIALAKQRFNAEVGGMYAESGKLYEVPIRPRFLDIGTTAGFGEAWVLPAGTAGWNTALLNNNVINNVVLGIQGFYLTGVQPRNKVQAIRVITGSTTLPVIWVEGAADQMEKPCVVFPEGYVLPPQSPHEVDLSFRTADEQSFQPFGVAIVKQQVAVATAPASV